LKLGIPLLIIGVIMVVCSVPFSVILLMGGVNRLMVGDVSGGALAYAGIAAAVIGMIITTIGASRVFKN
jgi:hypothetical protein